jgi:hypothetical protein
MDYILSKESFDKCEICAYHESGHIVFAYLCGYSCMEAQLINRISPEGFSSYALIDYGKDSFIASKLIGQQADYSFFKSLNLSERLDVQEIALRLCRIFLGGSVSTAVFLNEGNPHVPLPLQLDYTDLKRVESIQAILKEMFEENTEDVIENSLKDVIYSFNNLYIWNSVDALAKRLLETNQLEKNDIEECLQPFGISSNKEFMQLSN